MGGIDHYLLSTRGGAVMSFGQCGVEGGERGYGRKHTERRSSGLGADVGRAVEATAIADLTVATPRLQSYAVLDRIDVKFEDATTSSFLFFVSLRPPLAACHTR